jgi:glycosyltransferase involved in cell wall biosynthesis
MDNRPLRLLFVKHHLAYPRASGHDVYVFEMMKALAELGHEISLTTVREPEARALAGVRLHGRWCLDKGLPPMQGRAPHFTWLQERYRSYWGIERSHISAVGAIAKTLGSDAVIVVGLEALPFVGALDGAVRVWYPADEWVWHHLSLIKWRDRHSWTHFPPAVVKGVYERAFRSLIDRVWVVTETERRAMRWFAGMNVADVLPLGIDSDHYRPRETPESACSAVFWGRLDFEPNIQALTWFCRDVWPLVRKGASKATFTIVGFNPGTAIKRLGGLDGVSISADLPDLRQEVSRHQVVVLPFVSGGGIKNKLLEAASLAKPIVCTPRACNGLRGLQGTELVSVRRPEDWSREILGLWSNEERRRALGNAARNWAIAHHGWPAIAREAVAALEHAIRSREAAARNAPRAA